MKFNRTIMLAVFALLAVSVGAIALSSPAVAADDRSDAQLIVDRARFTVNDFMRDPNFTWFQENLQNAKGLLIFPKIVKGAFIIGGSGGTGILVAKNGENCNWSDPAFYTIGSASLGLQAGGTSAESIIMIMTDRAMDSLMRSSLRLGSDVSIAAGPNSRTDVVDIRSDLIAFSKARGLYAGIDLSGSVVHVRDSLNRAYYGRYATPEDIVMNYAVQNRGANDLLFTLRRDLIGPEGYCPA